MRVVIAPDKFKGSLSAPEAARAMAEGVAAAWPGARCDRAPLADGGEGTVEAMVEATGGSYREATVHGPLGDPVSARYGLLGDGATAVIEMAAASGLGLIAPDRRDPLLATTRGTGELIRHALASGARRIVLGIGGSATNDGGAGLAQALGYRLLDRDGRELEPGGAALGRLDRIEADAVPPTLREGFELSVACDVDNPMVGSRGASAIFGAQKFAPTRPPTPEQIAGLDANLTRLAQVIERDLGREVATVPGSGAAGGLGGGLIAFTGGRLLPGIVLVMEAVGLRRRLEGAELCLTGEGSLDAQSASGKTVVGVARLARSLGIPTLALAGSIGAGAARSMELGLAAYFSICDGPLTLDEAIGAAPMLLRRATEQAVRAYRVGRERCGPSAAREAAPHASSS